MTTSHSYFLGVASEVILRAAQNFGRKEADARGRKGGGSAGFKERSFRVAQREAMNGADQ